MRKDITINYLNDLASEYSKAIIHAKIDLRESSEEIADSVENFVKKMIL